MFAPSEHTPDANQLLALAISSPTPSESSGLGIAAFL